MTRYDLDTLRAALPIDSKSPTAALVFRVLFDRTLGLAPDPVRLAREFDLRVVSAVTGLYPPERWPALLLVPPPDAPDDWGWDAVRALERLAVEKPRLPVGVALTAGQCWWLATERAGARATELAREGFVEVAGVSRNQLESRLTAAGLAAPVATIERLTADGLADDVATAFVAATRAVAVPTSADIASDFRSVHEEFLFGALESLPQTAGLFRPNRPLGFRHGTKEAEGDLVAESLKLAVEVDGAFYHLNPDQYTRDRRKDWLYQRHGYLVLRFLAEDVVRELETVLDTILEAVALRRASATPTGAP